MAELDASAFDFWLGEWDCDFEGGHAVNTVTREYDGNVVMERFRADSPRRWAGMSVSVRGAHDGVWRQTWVDDAGGYLDFTGGFDGDRMILSREAEINGTVTQQRMVFRNIEANSLDWDWEVSTDGGETWQMRWQIRYARKGSSSSSTK